MELALAALIAVPPAVYFAGQRSQAAVAAKWARLGEFKARPEGKRMPS